MASANPSEIHHRQPSGGSYRAALRLVQLASADGPVSPLVEQAPSQPARLVRQGLTIVLEHEASQLLGGTLLARLEPLDAHPELGRKLAQRFHRGRARPGFDPADEP